MWYESLDEHQPAEPQRQLAGVKARVKFSSMNCTIGNIDNSNGLAQNFMFISKLNQTCINVFGREQACTFLQL